MPESAVALADTVDADTLLSVVARIRAGDLTARMPLDATGAAGEIATAVNTLIEGFVRPSSEVPKLRHTINDLVDQLNGFVSELTLVAREVGVEDGREGEAQPTEADGVWKDLTDDVNDLGASLADRVRAIAARTREARASAEQLRQLSDVAPIGIFKTDADNRYVYTNACWTEITGVRAEEAAGKPWNCIIDPTGCADSLGTRVDRIALGGTSFRFAIRRRDSTPRIALLTSRSIPDRRGGIAGWIGTLADVTAEAGAEAALAAAHAAALDANQMQVDFAASASHELRTPTTSIIAYTEEMLESDTLSPQNREYLQVVYRNARRLSRLVDDLLILDEVEIGASMMRLEPTALGPLAERVHSNFSAVALRAGVELTTDCSGQRLVALVDPMRLEQALTNLVSNALKFTPRGGEVTIGLRRTGRTAQLSVADTGIGIDAEDVDHIFDRFYRAKGAVEAAIKGSGLGLAIAKRMVEAQNGEMSVTSSLGRGTTFTMTLPVATRALRLAG
jgi:PAS domain S-box-containing protein